MSLTCCQIDWACTHYLPPRCAFLGVLPANRIPTPKQLRKYKESCVAFIVNTDPSFMPGSHWLAFYRPSGISSRLECFDSFGLPASHYGLVANTAPSSECICKTQFQANNTATCGYFCLFYILHRATRNRSIHSIIRTLKGVLRISADAYVKDFVKTYWPFPSTPSSHCK